LHAETSHVARAYEASDGRIFECPCPLCGCFAEITWACIEWPDGEPEAAAWRCPNCAGLVPERAKFGMVTAGTVETLAPAVASALGSDRRRRRQRVRCHAFTPSVKVGPVGRIGSPGRIGLARCNEFGRGFDRDLEGLLPASGFGPGVGASSFPNQASSKNVR
jgi:phage terminase large subunit GpA